MDSKSPSSVSPPASLTPELSDNHKRKVVSGLTYLERLLVDSETLLNSTSNFSLSRHRADLTPMQVQVAHDYIGRVRSRMEETVRLLSLPTPSDRPSRAWEIQVTLLSAEIALEEISSKGLIGYGALAPHSAQSLDCVVADLGRLLQQLRRYLGKSSLPDLETRVTDLKESPVGIEALKKLERIITKRGYVEFRVPFEALLQRIEDDTFEIAIFGRVSSGKSSLLNAVLGIDALPVGVTPVTAVPTRLVYGTSASAIIRFAESPEQTISLAKLAEFISEGGNPDNSKHVTRATVNIPSSHLREGITFVDTPGIGSLAASGARESFSYLPLCDLGVLLIDSTGTLNQDDLQILRELQDGGIRFLVVLTKSDLLELSEREKLRLYTEAQITKFLGRACSIHCVSTEGKSSVLATQWFQSEIEPIFDQNRELRRDSIRRKFETLRDGVNSALRASLKNDSSKELPSPQRFQAIQELALTGEGLLQTAGRQCEEYLEAIIPKGLETAQSALLEALHRKPKENPTPFVIEKLAMLEEFLFQQFKNELLKLQRGLVEHLRKMAQLAGATAPLEDLRIDLLSRPRWSFSERVAPIAVKPPSILHSIPALFERSVRRTFEDKYRELIRTSAQDYYSQLREWCRRSLEQLSQQFSAYSEPFRVRHERFAENGGVSGEKEKLEEDLKEITSLAMGGGTP